METIAARLRALRCGFGVALLVIAFAGPAPARAADPLAEAAHPSGPARKREALLAELQEIEHALQEARAELRQIRPLSESLKRKKARLTRTEADLAKHAAKVRDALEKLAREASNPFTFPATGPTLQQPILIFQPCPTPPAPRWPPPWPPPGVFPPRREPCPHPSPDPPAIRIYPLGTPGWTAGTPQGMFPLSGLTPLR